MDSNSSCDESDVDEFEEKAPLKPGVERPYFNNKEGMELKLKSLIEESDWLQHMVISVPTSELNVPADAATGTQTSESSIQDDFRREMMFYCQAQVAAKEALAKLRELGLPTQRPEDYFAEMAKTDSHMQKVRSKLLEKKQSLDKSEKAKKQRQMKKFGKKIQQEVLQKRQQEKKNMMKDVDRIKKGKEKLSKNKDDQDDFDVSAAKIGAKRKSKDEKFGFGGKKRKLKKNSKESTQDLNFKPSIHSNKVKQKNPGKFSNKNSNNKSKRLGKSRRHQAKKR